MPSMPVGLWGDPDGARYRDTYFDVYPGVWRHGDWVRFSPVGSAVIAGRSDATLNRGGVRLGTAEFYRVVEEFPEVVDSLVVHLEDPAGGNGELLLYVQLRARAALDDALRRRIATALRTELSPRHVPDGIASCPVTAQPDGQEAGAAGQAHPARRGARRRGQPRRPRRPHRARSLRRPRRQPGPVVTVQRVAVVGTGVIGASWAAHFLAHGLDVTATDPSPGAEDRLRSDVAAIWPTLTPAAGGSPERLAFTSDPAEAVADADFVQENGPEREDVKHALFAVLDAAARPDVVLREQLSACCPASSPGAARGIPSGW
jgi:hypothetical protein